MEITNTILQTREIIKKIKNQKKTIGFIPTMGALHKGHLSLIQKSKEETDFTVVSIYVNPLQFGPKEDFKKYPRNFEKDKQICKKAGVDLIFYPSDNEMYPAGNYIETYIDQHKLPKVLCGRFRKGHFRGVMIVVAKLFNIIQPDIAYFGAKDFQQAVIIKNMVNDLNFDINIKILPTIREKDGLALSSRNQYLTLKERKQAPYIYKALLEAKRKIENGNIRSPGYLKTFIKNIITKNITTLKKIDYIEIVNPDNLQSQKTIKPPSLIAIALHTTNARLIDNILVPE